MPRVPRTQLAPDGNSVTLHCYNRCVRRAGLCGYDPQTGIDYGYRKDWIQERLRELAGIFAIDLLSFAIMDNHFHLTCRTRPDISDNWTDDEVALRWYKLFPKRRTPDGQPAEPTEKELEDCLADSRNFSQEEWPKELRRRLQNISWLMKSICEPIAKRANKEDGVTGAFFQARFHCKKLLDESAILACSVYVELNPVRAVQAESPEQSKHTSVYERIVEHKFSQTKAAQKSQPKRFPTLRTSTGAKFLAPVRMEDRTSAEQSPEVTSRVRASDKGFLRLSLEKYLELIDWSGRQFHKEKPGAIPSHLAPILERLELNVETWLHSLQNFGKSLGWAIGKRTSMLKEQRRMGRTRMRGRPIQLSCWDSLHIHSFHTSRTDSPNSYAGLSLRPQSQNKQPTSPITGKLHENVAASLQDRVLRQSLCNSARHSSQRRLALLPGLKVPGTVSWGYAFLRGGCRPGIRCR